MRPVMPAYEPAFASDGRLPLCLHLSRGRQASRVLEPRLTRRPRRPGDFADPPRPHDGPKTCHGGANLNVCVFAAPFSLGVLVGIEDDLKMVLFQAIRFDITFLNSVSIFGVGIGASTVFKLFVWKVLQNAIFQQVGSVITSESS